jgi:exodeoxyribonuclease VII large subunit
LEAALAMNARKHEAALLRVGARLQPGLVARDLSRRTERVKDLGQRAALSLARRLPPYRAQLDRDSERMHQAMRRTWGDKRKALRSVTQLLQTLDHKSVLSRGYALVWRANATLAKRAEILSPGETISLEFADSRRLATIAGGPGGGSALKAAPEGPIQGPVPGPIQGPTGVAEGPKTPFRGKNGKKGGDGGGQTSLF